MSEFFIPETPPFVDDNTQIRPEESQARKTKSEYCDLKMISQDIALNYGRDWHQNMLKYFESLLVDGGDFPCIFGRSAFRKKILKFIFVESIDTAGIQHLADGLVEYVNHARGWDGGLNTASPLVIAFSLDVIRDGSWDDYHAFGWSILQKLHEIDPAPWPQDVATDPRSESWSMCFNGMQLFCNMSHPAHKVRRSRNLGEHFLFVVNPRERFDVVAGNNPTGRKVRDNIRERIAKYDGVPPSLQLGSYGSGGLEWWQYGIIEDNAERTDACPFAFAHGSAAGQEPPADANSPVSPAKTLPRIETGVSVAD